jgi:hypothetical protein
LHKAVVLFVASHPASPRSVTLDGEMRDLGRWLRPPSCPIGLTLRTCWTSKTEHLERALADAGQAILHVSGRGAAPGDAPVGDSVRLRELVGALEDRVRLVILDRCDDDELAHGLAEDVDCVVGVPASIRSGVATAFLDYFYLLLAYGRDPGEAFRLGMAATDLDGIERGKNPRLVMRNGVVPADARLSSLSAAAEGGWTAPGHHCTVILSLDSSPADLQGHRLAVATTLLRERASDERLLVETIAGGGFSLRVTTTEEGRARLLASIESREIVDLDQLSIVAAETDLLPDWQVERCRTDSTRLPRPHTRAGESLLIVSLEGGQPISDMRLALDEVDEVLIGRAPQAQSSAANRQLTVAVPDPAISRLHLRLEHTVEGWSLNDVGSANGTRVNGHPVTRCALADGDIIEISRAVLVFRQIAT